MQWKIILTGLEYSSQKEKFKKILKENSLKWKGTLSNAVWESSDAKVRAIFKRDETKDITLEAILILDIKDSKIAETNISENKLFNDLSSWAKGFGKAWILNDVNAKKELTKTSDFDEKKLPAEVRSKLEFWDMFHKPQESYMRRMGCPETYIRCAIQAWKEEREKVKAQYISES
ncbi:MAG: hypothetical protein QXT63_00955 [Thermoplasmata archaeon]